MSQIDPISEPRNLTDAKRKLLDKLLLGELGNKSATLPPITHSSSRGPFPLSNVQQQIWLHAQMAPDLPVYNEPVTLHKRGSLDVAVLRRCFVEIVRRHE